MSQTVMVLPIVLVATVTAVCGYLAGLAHARLSQHKLQARETSQMNANYERTHTEMIREQTRADGLARQVAQLQHELEATRLAEERRLDRLREQERYEQEQREQTLERAHEQESTILTMLAPVKHQLQQIGERVGQIESERHQEMGQVSRYLEILNAQQQRLGEQTTTLAQALSDNSLRGAWGELQLRNVVDAAGLLEHVDYDLQVVQSAGEQRGIRPDMVVHLPGGKHLVVDAKVPYAQYQYACAVQGEDVQSKLNREQYMRAHAKSLREHVRKLSAKEYWLSFENTPEFVVAFIPNETLLQAALRYDPTLLDDAFSHNVALTTPVTLWSMLKTVAFSWQQQALSQDAKELFELSRQLYTRFSTVGKYAANLGDKLKASVSAYNMFATSLESRLLVTARKLNTLDASKTINTVDTLSAEQATIVTLSAPELEERPA